MTTNTTTITATPSVTTFDLAGMKTWEPAELSTFSLHAYNRVRIASHSFSPDELDILEMSQSEARKILSWLTELDARGFLASAPEPFPINARCYGGIVHAISYEVTRNHDIGFWYDRSLAIHSKTAHTGNRVACAKLSQAETMQFMAWLQRHMGGCDQAA